MKEYKMLISIVIMWCISCVNSYGMDPKDITFEVCKKFGVELVDYSEITKAYKENERIVHEINEKSAREIDDGIICGKALDSMFDAQEEYRQKFLLELGKIFYVLPMLEKVLQGPFNEKFCVAINNVNRLKQIYFDIVRPFANEMRQMARQLGLPTESLVEWI